MSNKKLESVKRVIAAIESGKLDVTKMRDEVLLGLIKWCNSQYRSGDPIASDSLYDHVLIAELKRRYPNHEFLNKVEPEEPAEKTTKLPERMLSTDKSYDPNEIEKWVKKIRVVGNTCIRATPKLDGFAAYHKDGKLLTRGDGYKGTDISHVLDRGLKFLLERVVNGPGEIVVNSGYFKHNLAGKYENSRNVISSVIKVGELNDDIKLAIERGMIVFAPFSSLNHLTVTKPGLLHTIIDELWDKLTGDCDYDTDGLVFEADSESVKNEMGHTSHHHRWQIAFKRNTEFKDVKVMSITWQTGKTGVITPVAELTPTRISGAELSRATCHNAGNLIEKGIGPGAIVRVFRSGLVIPYIERVIKKSDAAFAPAKCPSCGSRAEMLKPTKRGEKELHLVCTNNSNCPAQVEGIIEYWFKTLGNCDGFGPKTVSEIASYGIDDVRTIYDLELENFENIGIGSGTSANLIDQLYRSRTEEIEDWRFLAAFSIHNVGKGGCEKLLEHHKLEDVFSLTVDDIVEIDGFAEKTAGILVESLARIKSDFDYLYGLGFNLARTPLLSEAGSVSSPIKDKVIVVSGSLRTSGRDDMHKLIKSLGGVVGKTITGKTDILVIGNNVGASKMKAAEKHGTRIIAEIDFLKLIEVDVNAA